MCIARQADSNELNIVKLKQDHRHMGYVYFQLSIVSYTRQVVIHFLHSSLHFLIYLV